MKNYIFILCMIGSICYSLNCQTLNLDFGSNFIQEKQFFQEDERGWANFMYVGFSYVHDNNVKVGIAYTLDIHQLTINTSVPLFALKRKRNCDVYALLNHQNNKSWIKS